MKKEWKAEWPVWLDKLIDFMSVTKFTDVNMSVLDQSEGLKDELEQWRAVINLLLWNNFSLQLRDAELILL